MPARLIKRATVAVAQPVDLPKRPPRRKGAATGGRPNKTEKSKIAAAVGVVVIGVVLLAWLDGSPPGVPENSRKARQPPPPTTTTSVPMNERRDRSESVLYNPPLSQFAPSPRLPLVGIVTTISSPDPLSFESWLQYHIAAGFDKIYLFWDTPAADLEFVQALVDRFDADPVLSRTVEVIISDGRLHSEQRKTSQMYKQLGEMRLMKEQMARQTVNCETALQKAQDDGVDWLLHIDADEIFHLPVKDGTAPEHFSRLDQLGLNQVVYLNKEAVYPDASLEPARAHENLFASTISFKNNPLLFDRQKLDIMHEWRDSHLKYFMSYSNGKAATRTDIDALPLEVTRFVIKNEFPKKKVPASKRSPNSAVFSSPAILHFTNAGFTSFMNKYKRIAKAGSNMDQSPFMLHMVNMVKKGSLASEFKNMYRRVASASALELTQFANQGLFSTITEIKAFVKDGNRLSTPRRRQPTPRDPGTLEGSDVTLILAHTQMGLNAAGAGSDVAEATAGRVTKCSGAPSWVCFAPEIDCCFLLKGSMGWADAFDD